MKIYTKTGDKGQTSLYDQTRISKNNIRVESYGTIDELNCQIGMTRQWTEDEEVNKILHIIQRKLFNVGGELAMVDGSAFPERITLVDIEWLETIIDEYLEKLGKDQAFQFIIPGSTKGSAAMHVSRTICRRAERRIISLAETENISDTILKFVNRLSDTLYTMGRYLEADQTLVTFDKSSKE